MQGRSVAYAASFGDARFGPGEQERAKAGLANFRAIALRENSMLPFVRDAVSVPCQRVIDPTLLLDAKDYDPITAESRRRSPICSCMPAAIIRLWRPLPKSWLRKRA